MSQPNLAIGWEIRYEQARHTGPMQQRISLVTLGVRDLARPRAGATIVRLASRAEWGG